MTKGRAISTWLKLAAFLVVVIVLYCVLRGIGFGTVYEAARRADRKSILAAVLLNFCVFLLWAFRVQLMMQREERGSILALFPIYMAGVFGNVVTPGARVGGEPIRAYYMWKVYGGERSRHLGVLLTDKLGNMSVFMVFLLFSVSFVGLFVPLAPTMKIILEAAVLMVVLGVVSGFLLHRRITTRSRLPAKLLNMLYNMPVLHFLRRRFATYQQFEQYAIRKLDNVFRPVGQAARSPKAIAKLVLISTAGWLLLYAAHYVLFRGIGADVSFLEVVIIVTISCFVGDLSVSPGGAGFMETAMIGLCVALGVDHGTAAAVTLISRGIFYFYGLVVGGSCFVVLASLYGRGTGHEARRSSS